MRFLHNVEVWIYDGFFLLILNYHFCFKKNNPTKRNIIYVFNVYEKSNTKNVHEAEKESPLDVEENIFQFGKLSRPTYFFKPLDGEWVGEK